MKCDAVISYTMCTLAILSSPTNYHQYRQYKLSSPESGHGMSYIVRHPCHQHPNSQTRPNTHDVLGIVNTQSRAECSPKSQSKISDLNTTGPHLVVIAGRTAALIIAAIVCDNSRSALPLLRCHFRLLQGSKALRGRIKGFLRPCAL